MCSGAGGCKVSSVHSTRVSLVINELIFFLNGIFSSQCEIILCLIKKNEVLFNKLVFNKELQQNQNTYT